MSYKDKLRSNSESLFGITLNSTILNKEEEEISAHTILSELAKGESMENLAKAYPNVSSSDVYSCLEYAADLVNSIELRDGLHAISINKKKRMNLADKIRSLKGKPPPGWPE